MGTNRTDGKTSRMNAGLAELKEGEKLFPLAKPIAESILGSVEESKAYTDEKLAPLRTDVKGVNERMRVMTEKADSIEQRAATIERNAGEASSAAQHAESVADIAKGEAERAAEAAMAAKTTLEQIAQRDNEVPKLAVRALEGVVKATVTDTDPKGKETRVEKKGADLIQHLANAIENAQVVAGKAADEAEESRSLLEQAKTMIQEQRQADDETRAQERETITALDAAVTKAEGAATSAAGAAAEVKKAFDAVSEGVETLKIQMSMIAAVLLGKASIKDQNTREIIESAIEEGDS